LRYSDPAVRQAIARYPDLVVAVLDYEAASQLTRSVMLAAKRRASQPGVVQRHREALDAESRDFALRATRRPPRPISNIGVPVEELPAYYRRGQGDDDDDTPFGPADGNGA
jgi:hypothetical protein